MEDLARLSFKRNPLYVGIDDTQAEATREGLEQGYCVVPSAQRFLLLFTFLKKNASKKARRRCPCHLQRCDAALMRLSLWCLLGGCQPLVFFFCGFYRLRV